MAGWLNRWGRERPKATLDVLDRLDAQTKDEVLSCARASGMEFEEEQTARNRQVYGILEHLGKLSIVLHFLWNMGMNASELANEFGTDIAEMRGALEKFGVEKVFRAKKRSSATQMLMARMLDDLGLNYDVGRRLTYTYNGHRYSAFPSFLLLDYKVMIFIKDSVAVEKAGRQDVGLKTVGYKVLRFHPQEVREEQTRVAFDIETAVQSLKITKDDNKTYVLAIPNR